MLVPIEKDVLVARKQALERGNWKHVENDRVASACRSATARHLTPRVHGVCHSATPQSAAHEASRLLSTYHRKPQRTRRDKGVCAGNHRDLVELRAVRRSAI